MKKIVPLLLFLSFFTFYLSGQEIQKDVRDVGEFNEIYIGEGLSVLLKQGEEEKVVIQGEEKYLKSIDAFVSNSVLKIQLADNLSKSQSPTVMIIFKDIEKLAVNGETSLKSISELNFNKLSMGFNGESKVDLKINVNTSLSVKIVKADVNLFGQTGVFSSNLSDGGKLSLDLDADKIRCTIEDGTEAKLAGTCDLLFANISGGGKLNSYDLQSDKVRISIFGNSIAEVMVLRELHTIADGECKVYYKGSPRAVKSEKSGGAQVIKAK